jgi:hypothetical protein
MTESEYYTAPDQEVFDEIKAKAIEIWKGYDDTYGYATGKINAIKDIENVQDNAWYIVAMFDCYNQSKLITSCSERTAKLIQDAKNT